MGQKLIIEVTGTSTRNKGAELMLLAIKQHFEKLDTNIELTVDLSFGGWKERARYGLAGKVEIAKFGRSRIALHLMPASFRRTLGMVRDVDTDAILDASGFAFGDQHPLERSTRFATQVERWSAEGKPVILLPQALGPFEKPGYAEAFRRIMNASTLVFARDPESFQHAEQAVGESGTLRMAPDFTNLVKPGLSALSAESRRVCIVPNQRMLEKAKCEKERKQYISLLADCVGQVIAMGLEPLALLHGEEDAELVRLLNVQLASELPVHGISDPLEIKRFIGESHLVIGSRFHALVSALSQGVPALATSWSHKYEALFADYNQQNCILPVDIGPDQLREHIGAVTGDQRVNVVEIIRQGARALEQQTQEMWHDVNLALGLRNQADNAVSG